MCETSGGTGETMFSAISVFKFKLGHRWLNGKEFHSSIGKNFRFFFCVVCDNADDDRRMWSDCIRAPCEQVPKFICGCGMKVINTRFGDVGVLEIVKYSSLFKCSDLLFFFFSFLIFFYWQKKKCKTLWTAETT